MEPLKPVFHWAIITITINNAIMVIKIYLLLDAVSTAQIRRLTQIHLLSTTKMALTTMQLVAVIRAVYVLRAMRKRHGWKRTRKHKFWIRKILKIKSSSEYNRLYKELQIVDREYHFWYAAGLILYQASLHYILLL